MSLDRCSFVDVLGLHFHWCLALPDVFKNRFESPVLHFELGPLDFLFQPFILKSDLLVGVDEKFLLLTSVEQRCTNFDHGEALRWSSRPDWWSQQW